MRWLHSITDSVAMNSGELQDIVESRGIWPATVRGVPKSRTQVSD